MREISIPNKLNFKIKKDVLEKLNLLLIVLSMILIGSDRISISVGGLTIRFVQMILILEGGILLLKGKYKIVISMPILAVIITHLLSTIISKDFKASVAYDFWLIYNFIFVIYVFYSYAKDNPKEKVIDLIMLSFIIQSIYVYIQFIGGIFGIDDIFFPMQHHLGVYRPSIWFYEPSYLATYFSIYFSLSLYLLVNLKSEKYIFNTINGLLSLIFITSSTGYLAIGFSVVLILVLNIKQILMINKKVLIAIISFIVLAIIIVPFLNINFINVFLGRLFNNGIVNSSGGRVSNWKYTFDIFLKHPILGVGPNAYMGYTQTNFPPTNVSLELLANTGIAGFLSFYYFLGNMIIKAYKKESKSSVYNKGIAISILVFIVTLQANQNYMRLYLWMFMGILLGFLNREEE